MGMSWDFTNYTFSFLVSLIGTILGICYPLFLENIRKIDDQYQSTVLAKRFQEAPVFKLYRLLLIAAIIISFLAPFIMLFSDNSIINIIMYLQPIITQYFIDNKSEIWLLFLIAHSKR